MNVLLVCPESPETFWSFTQALKYVRKKASFPPLGLITVAALLPKDWHLKLVDMNIEKLKDDDIKWADMVFVSAMIVQKDSAQTVINRAKKLGKLVVAGGPYFSSCDMNTVKGVDHFVLNEAEITLPMFLRDLEHYNAQAVYTSVEKPSLLLTPLPRWDLVKMNKYVSMALQYSRGCPFNCEFCDITSLFGKATRSKIPAQFIYEIEHLHRYGWRGQIFIVDDNLIGNVIAVKNMLRELISWQKANRYPFSFLTEASVNLAKDTELMSLMRDAGFVKVFLGIETPDKESLKECHKGQNTNVDLVSVVKTIHSYGMEVMGGFIVGFDQDHPIKTFEAQIDFITKAKIPVAMVGILTALPNTPLWKRLKEGKRLTGNSTGNNVSSGTNFIPTMGMDNLISGHSKIISTIYSSKEYYGRVHAFLRDFNPTRMGKVKWSDVIAFAQSTVRIGIFSGARFAYWKLMLSHCTNLRRFSLAVEFAIIGEHFRKMAKEVSLSARMQVAQLQTQS